MKTKLTYSIPIQKKYWNKAGKIQKTLPTISILMRRKQEILYSCLDPSSCGFEMVYIVGCWVSFQLL